jgi:hypothetical protein
VQLGAGLGLVGAGLVAAWIFFNGARPTASTAPIQTTTTTKAIKAENDGKSVEGRPLDGKAAADPSGHQPLATTPTIVRPVLEAEAPLHPAPEQPSQPTARPAALEDDDPRAPHNFNDDNTVYPSASAKKKELAAAQKRPRPKPRPQPAVEPPRSEPPTVSPEQTTKKTNPLDLFDDTK